MNKFLAQFVTERLARVTGAVLPVRVAYTNFLEQIDHRERRLWPRWRFVSELREAGWAISRRYRVDELVGVSLLPPMSSAVEPPRMSAAIDAPDTSAVSAEHNV